MSTIRAMGGADTQASIYAGTQAGLDAACAALVSGGAVEVGPSLESLTQAINPGTVVIRFRVTPTPGFELMSGDLILANGQSVRFVDTVGTIRTVLTALVSGVTRLAYLSSGGLTITDQNGNIKCTITGTRMNLASGFDFAPNNLPGSSGQVLTSQGAAASPTWTTLSGVSPGSSNTQWFAAQDFAFDDTGIERVFYRDAGATDTGYLMTQYSGASDVFSAATMVVPRQYVSTASWKVYVTTSGTSTNPIVVRFGLSKLTDGSTAAAAFTVTDNTWNPGGTADVLKVLTVTTPSVTLAAGDVFKVMVERRASSDAGDTNADAMNLVGALFTFNT